MSTTRTALLDSQDDNAETDATAPGDAAPAEAPPKFTLRGEAWTMFMLGWPMVVSFVCRIGMASTDTAFVGHLTNATTGVFFDRPYSGEEYLAAASLSDMVVNILIVPPLAFNQVLNALVGQALGSDNKKMAGTWLQLSVFFLTTSYLPFMLIQYLFTADVLKLLGFNHDICELAGVYARWNLFWPIPNGIYQCMRFYFQAQGMPRPAMWNNLAFVLVNALLNWTFVFGGPLQYACGWTGFGFIGAAMSLRQAPGSTPEPSQDHACRRSDVHLGVALPAAPHVLAVHVCLPPRAPRDLARPLVGLPATGPRPPLPGAGAAPHRHAPLPTAWTRPCARP